MTIETKFHYGQDVQLATDPEKCKRRVIKIAITGNNHTEYLLAYGTEQSSHTECELEAYQEKPKAGF